MTKNLMILIFTCLALSIAIVVAVVVASGVMKDKRNSFLRQFPPHPIVEGDTLNINSSMFYLAGTAKNTVYLSNYRSPLHMLLINITTLDTQLVKLKVRGIHDQKFWAVKVSVDSPYYYLTDGAVPVIFKGNVYDWTAEKYLFDSIYYRDIVPVSSCSFAVKSLSGTSQENILGKLSACPSYVRFTDRILEKQLDGVFCTDGIMQYNRELNRLIYLYYYRNQFMVIDSNLNLLYRGNTIDTVSQARIKTATINSNTKVLASPPFIVNRGSTTFGNWLFVSSNLLAKNEHRKAFDQGAVVDTYSMKTGKYVFSFYIYNHNRIKKMTEFCAVRDRLIVRFDNLIRVYHMKPEYFKTPTN